MSAQDVDTATSETAVTAKRKFPGRKRKARKSAGPKVAARRRAASRNLQGSADRVLRQGKRAIDKAYSWAGDARSAVPRLARDLRLPRRSDFDVLTEANPMVMGAIGLGLGVVLGSLMPQKLASSRRAGTSQPGTRKSSRRRRGS
jgi:predicted lysophospholipase L1 biosynthesis ABC-type transport system permease subunit